MSQSKGHWIPIKKFLILSEDFDTGALLSLVTPAVVISESALIPLKFVLKPLKDKNSNVHDNIIIVGAITTVIATTPLIIVLSSAMLITCTTNYSYKRFRRLIKSYEKRLKM